MYLPGQDLNILCRYYKGDFNYTYSKSVETSNVQPHYQKFNELQVLSVDKWKSPQYMPKAKAQASLPVDAD